MIISLEQEIEERRATINLENKIETRIARRKPPKHKIGGYITEELYQAVHVVCAAKGISLSDLFQAVLSEYVETVEYY